MRDAVTARRGLARIVHWTARVWSVASLVLIIAFLVGEGFHPAQFSSSELVLFLLFPVGVCIGMLMGWAKEGLGGGLTVASLVGFYLLHVSTAGRFPRGWAFLAFSAPGFLFLLSRLWPRERIRPAA